MSDFTFNGVSYTEDEVKSVASSLGLSLDDYLSQNSDVQKVEPIDPGTEKTGGEGQSTFMGRFLESAADYIGAAAKFAPKALGDGPMSSFLSFILDANAISKGLKGNQIDNIEATYNLKNAPELTDEILNTYIAEKKEADKNSQLLTETQSFVEAFDKEMEDSGNPIMATAIGIKESGFGAFQSVMAQSLAGLLAPSAMKTGTGGAVIGGGIGTAFTPVGTIAGGFGGYSAFANAHVENMITFSNSIQEELQFRGKEFNAENVRELFKDEDAIRRMELTALKRGATIGTIEGLGSILR